MSGTSTTKSFFCYYVFLLIFSVMSTIILQLTVQRVINKSASREVYAHTNQTSERFYEEDVVMLMNRLPEILPMITALFIMDEHGYKFTYRVPLLGLSLSAVISLMPTNDSVPDFLTCYLATVIFGMCGGMTLALVGSFCHVIKYSETENLSVQFGRMISAVLIGQGFGAALSQTTQVNIHGIAMIAATSVVALIAALVCATDTQELFGITSVRSIDIATRNSSSYYTRKELVYLVTLVGILALHQACGTSQLSASKILALDQSKLQWTQAKFAVYTMLLLFCQAISNLILTPILIGQFYLPELTTVMIATACKTVSLALTSFATENWMLYLNLPIEIIDGLCLSCLLAVITRLSGPKDIRLILCIAMMAWVILECSGTLLTTAVSLQMYTTFYSWTFIFLALVMLLIFGCTLWLSINLRTHRHETLLENVRDEEIEDMLDIDGEQWLLDAYESDVAHVTVDTGVDEVIPTTAT